MKNSACIDGLVERMHDWYAPLRQRAFAQAQSLTHYCMEDSKSGREFQFDERFLQILWNEQRFQGGLCTVAGESITVISPGTWNVSAGPDFRDAVVRIGGVQKEGDVEIHRCRSDWDRHGHQDNPDYSRVILHGVWRNDTSTSGGDVPCLQMSDYVEGSLRDLMQELAVSDYPYGRKVGPGACALSWALSEDAAVKELLRIAGLARLEAKTIRFQRSILAVGANQALYEGIFEALGYRSNRYSFRQLAAATPLESMASLERGLELEAYLFGRAGLLPDPTVTRVSPRWRTTVRKLWDCWWEHGASPLDLSWTRSGCRPHNSPERRLSAGVGLLRETNCDLNRWVCNASRDACSGTELLRHLRSGLSFRSPWESSRTFGADAHPSAILIGPGRQNDLIANILLPFLAAQASRQSDSSMHRLVREAFLALPRLQNNRPLKEAAHRFLMPPSRERDLIRTACEQQGLLEIYKSFCGVLNGNCENCPFVSPRSV